MADVLGSDLMASLAAIQPERAAAITCFSEYGCFCSGTCGLSCSGDCQLGCSGNCGRSCSGGGS
jgi:hypothetical protein